MGCFIRDRTFPNGASVTSSLARVCVFREWGGSNLVCVRRLLSTTLPMKLCENSILSISFFLSFFTLLYKATSFHVFLDFFLFFCARSRYIRVLLIALITRSFTECITIFMITIFASKFPVISETETVLVYSTHDSSNTVAL